MKAPESSKSNAKQSKPNEKKSCFPCHQKEHVANCCSMKRETKGTSPVKSRPEVVEGSSLKASQKKVFKKRSCYNCRNRGHMASCCPFNKVEKSGEAKLQVKSFESESTVGSSQKKSVQKQQKGVALCVNGVGVDKMGVKSFQKNQPKFHPKTSTSGQFDRPRNQSPRYNNSTGKSNRFHKQNRYQNFGTRNFQEKQILNKRNDYRSKHYSNNQQLRFQKNSRNVSQRPGNQRGYRTSQNQKPSGRHQHSRLVQSSKTSERCDGYWTEFDFYDESGRLKTGTVWVPFSN